MVLSSLLVLEPSIRQLRHRHPQHSPLNRVVSKVDAQDLAVKVDLVVVASQVVRVDLAAVASPADRADLAVADSLVVQAEASAVDRVAE